MLEIYNNATVSLKRYVSSDINGVHAYSASESFRARVTNSINDLMLRDGVIITFDIIVYLESASIVSTKDTITYNDKEYIIKKVFSEASFSEVFYQTIYCEESE